MRQCIFKSCVQANQFCGKEITWAVIKGMGGENKRKGMIFTVGLGVGRCVAHLWHGADFMHLADELTVGLKKQQQLEMQLV